MVISIRKQSFFATVTSHVEDVFEVYLDDILFASSNTHEEARLFARGLMVGVKYFGKSCSLNDEIPIQI